MIAWQEPPPYVQYMAEAEALGRSSVLAGVCAALGIVQVNQQALDDLLADFDRRAIRAQTDGPILTAALRSGVDRERRAIEVMTDFGPDDGSVRRRRLEDEASEYLGNGCADLTIDYPEVFTFIGADDTD